MLNTLKRGAVAGAAGGAMMAMVAMITTAISGDGFWSPVNGIAHAAWSGAPLDGSFSAGAFALGILTHMAAAMMLGAGTAVLLTNIDKSTTKVMAAVGVGIGAWLIQLSVWPTVDQAGADVVPQWVLLVGHLIFGMNVGIVLAATPEHRRHRVGRPAAAAAT